MNLEIIDILLLVVIVGFELAYWLRDRRKENEDKSTQKQQILILQAILGSLTEQKEVLEDSHAELADMRDEMIEEPNEPDPDRNELSREAGEVGLIGTAENPPTDSGRQR